MGTVQNYKLKKCDKMYIIWQVYSSLAANVLTRTSKILRLLKSCFSLKLSSTGNLKRNLEIWYFCYFIHMFTARPNLKNHEHLERNKVISAVSKFCCHYAGLRLVAGMGLGPLRQKLAKSTPPPPQKQNPLTKSRNLNIC